MTTTGIIISWHARDVMRLRGIAEYELLAALGENVGETLDGRIAPAATGSVAAPGRPLRIGRQEAVGGGQRRHVLLAKTTKARHLVVVLARSSDAVVMITVWDQESALHLWDRSRLMPTELGRRNLPPTFWFASRQWDVTNGGRR